jgi:hypothetical protein
VTLAVISDPTDVPLATGLIAATVTERLSRRP